MTGAAITAAPRPPLRFFADSADPRDWRTFAAEGWLHGATTNPLILQRAGLATSLDTAKGLVEEALAVGLGELQVQSWGGSADALEDNGRALAALSPRLTVKIPATRAGLLAAARLAGTGIAVTLTACHTLRQCAAARRIGLAYVAPYYGRMIEAGLDADGRLAAMRAIAGTGGERPAMRVLVASVRSAEQLDHLLAAGCDTFTLTPQVAAAMMTDRLTEAASEEFERAAASRAVAPSPAAPR